jgi:hypothetical protein
MQNIGLWLCIACLVVALFFEWRRRTARRAGDAPLSGTIWLIIVGIGVALTLIAGQMGNDFVAGLGVGLAAGGTVASGIHFFFLER